MQWMKLCVMTVEYMIQVNNELIGLIFPKRGLRQGDPLSPYLFILCAKGLSALLNFERDRGHIHGIRMGRNGPQISHLMFADDCIFFCRATQEECTYLKEALCIYESASGQAINYQKSGVFFSKNVNEEEKALLSSIIAVTNPMNTGKYLGLPSQIRRDKKAIFSYLREKLWKKLQGWRGGNLSKAGKEILIKSVAQAIPSYCMSTFLLLASLAEEL